VHYGLGLEIGW